MTARESAQLRKHVCFLAEIDRMRVEAGVSDAAMHEFVSGMSDAQWAQLTSNANAHHRCRVERDRPITHGVPSEDTRREILDALFERLPYGRDGEQQSLALNLERRARRGMELVP